MQRERKHRAAQCPTSVAERLATHAQLEAEVQVAKFQEELRLKKDVPVSTTILALGLADNLEGQGNKLEALAHCSAKLMVHTGVD